MSHFSLRIFTPNQTILQTSCVSISIPTISGIIQVLSGHEELISKLVLGVVEIIDTKGSKNTFLANGGLLKVKNNDVEVSCIDIIQMGEKGFTEKYLNELKHKQNLVQTKIENAISNKQFYKVSDTHTTYLFAEERLARFELLKELSS